MEDRECRPTKGQIGKQKQFEFMEKYSGDKENTKKEGLSLLRVKKGQLKKLMDFDWSEE